jgi:hypothetical protein
MLLSCISLFQSIYAVVASCTFPSFVDIYPFTDTTTYAQFIDKDTAHKQGEKGGVEAK